MVKMLMDNSCFDLIKETLEQILRNNDHIFVVKLPSTTILVCNLHGDNTMKMHAIPSPLDIRL